MSARRATPEARCVWLNTMQRRALGSLEDTLPLNDWRQGQIEAIRQAWDAAPADPVARSAEAIRNEITGLEDEDAWYAAEAVLVALGYPDGSPRQETPGHTSSDDIERLAEPS